MLHQRRVLPGPVDLSHDPSLETGRWRLGSRCPQQAGGGWRAFDLCLARLACREVLLECRVLGRIQGVEGVSAGEQVAPPSVAGRSPSQSTPKLSRILMSPSRIRVLTVPNGTSSRSATCDVRVAPVEGEGDGLALQVGQVGEGADHLLALEAPLDRLGHDVVRAPALEQRDLGVPRRSWPAAERTRSTARRCARVIDPGGCGPRAGSKARRRPPEVDEHLLGHLLRLRLDHEGPAYDAEDRIGEAVVEPVEGRAVPAGHEHEQLLGRLRRLLCSCASRAGVRSTVTRASLPSSVVIDTSSEPMTTVGLVGRSALRQQDAVDDVDRGVLRLHVAADDLGRAVHGEVLTAARDGDRPALQGLVLAGQHVRGEPTLDRRGTSARW